MQGTIFLFLFNFLIIQSFKINWLQLYKTRNTNISCYDDIDCQNINLNASSIIDMDQTYPVSCKLNRCVYGYEFVSKYECRNSFDNNACLDVCNGYFRIIATDLNDCCQCLDVKSRNVNTPKKQCLYTNTDHNTIKNFQFCESDMLKTTMFCLDDLYCQQKCNDVFGLGIYGYCDHHGCLCYRKQVETWRAQTKAMCYALSCLRSSVNFVYINNMCIFSKYPNTLNKCNIKKCQTICNYETGSCLGIIY